jgi:hypothetical protein
MNLRQELKRYLSIRRSLGYDLGTTERVLHRFVEFADQEQAEHITTSLLLRLNKGRQLPAEVVEGRASPKGNSR